MPLQLTSRADDDQDIYFELVKRFPLKPIRNDKELRRANAMLDELLELDEMTADQEAYFDVLEGLVREYELENVAIPPVTDDVLLRHLMEAKDVSQIEVANATGIVYTTISAVLGGKRTLTRQQIGRLSRYFGVSPETFSFSVK